MKNLYRIAIGAFMLLMGVIFFIVNFLIREGESSGTAGSDGPYIILMIIIASLVVVIVPSIFILIRLVRR